MTLLIYNFKDFIPFDLAWQWQKDLVKDRKQNPNLPNVLLLLEHYPVYTIGQGSSLSFFKRPIPYVQTERGGEVTYHAPGQLVAYVIINLRHYQLDLHWYLRQLEEVVIQSLGELKIECQRKVGQTGVWIKDAKVAQIGIKVSRWITMHGLAINVSVDKTGFEPIVPCGIANCKIANIQDYCRVEMEEVKELVGNKFHQLF